MMQIVALILSAVALRQVAGHGMLMDPPNRSSIWRFDGAYPPNYDDNQNFCGGFDVQYDLNGGRCGVCGDPWTAPHPQENEHTGKYGRGKIVASYQSGSVIETQVKLTANHMGKFEFSLCEINNEYAPESGESCFRPLAFSDGSYQFKIVKGEYKVLNKIQLPKGYTCRHCVLRWTYTAGNNWNPCADGTGALGCGNQEMFRSCADISIV